MVCWLLTKKYMYWVPVSLISTLHLLNGLVYTLLVLRTLVVYIHSTSWWCSVTYTIVPILSTDLNPAGTVCSGSLASCSLRNDCLSASLESLNSWNDLKSKNSIPPNCRLVMSIVKFSHRLCFSLTLVGPLEQQTYSHVNKKTFFSSWGINFKRWYHLIQKFKHLQMCRNYPSCTCRKNSCPS